MTSLEHKGSAIAQGFPPKLALGKKSSIASYKTGIDVYEESPDFKGSIKMDDAPFALVSDMNNLSFSYSVANKNSKTDSSLHIITDAQAPLKLKKPAETRHNKAASKPVHRIFDKKADNNLSVSHKNIAELKKTKSLTHSAPELQKPVLSQPVIYSDPVAPYYKKIFEHMVEEQGLNKCQTNPFLLQKGVNKRMRFIIFNWLLENVHAYNLKKRTLFLAGNLMDRFLATSPVSRGKFQLVGVTCLFIAAKYEEIRPPSLRQMAMLLDDQHEEHDILHTEASIMLALNFNLHAHLAVDLAEVAAKTFGLACKDVTELMYEVLVVFSCHHFVDKFDMTKLAYFAIAYALKNAPKVCAHNATLDSLSNNEYWYFERKMKNLIMAMRNEGLKGLDKLNKTLHTAMFR